MLLRNWLDGFLSRFSSGVWRRSHRRSGRVLKSRRSGVGSAETLEVRTLLSASTATFKLQTGIGNPLSGQDVGIGQSVAIGDINGDGLADVIAGDGSGTFSYYKNTGTATIPAYTLQAGAANPLNGQDVGSYAAPAMGDLTGDGLLHLIVGRSDGTFVYYKNTGTLTSPAFTLQIGAANPLDGQDIGSLSTPALGDLNADGRLDLVAGKNDGTFSYYLNTGSATNPAFTLQTGAANPFDSFDVGTFSTPTLGDLNGDGRLDLVSGQNDGTFLYYQNIGTATTPAFTPQTGTANPLNGQDIGTLSAPALGDLNNDGRLDLLAMNQDGTFTYDMNVGPFRPTLARQLSTANPLNTQDIGFSSIITSGDLSGDGLPDLIVGSYDGTFNYFKNTGTLGNPAYTRQTGASNPLSGTMIGARTAPALGDLNGDGLLDLIIGVGGGTVRYLQNTGTATNPAFTMITGSGNPLNGQSTPANSTAPAIGDLNGDGLLDLILGTSTGGFTYYQNTGTATAPVLTLQSAATNPLNGKDVGKYATPTLGDINGDGTLDLVSGNREGVFYYFQNTGTATNPAFTEQRDSWNPLNGQVVGIPGGNLYSAPMLADLDGDGALDLISGNVYGNFLYYKNLAAPVVPRVVSKTDADNPLNGQDVGDGAAPTFGDLTGDGRPDLIVGNKDGSFSYYLNSGTTPTPVLTLQAGAANPLNGEDIGSYSTPALGDLTGDGLLDLIVGNSVGTFSFYKNTGSSSAPAFTLQTAGANPLDGQDVGSFSSPTLADLNGDGLLDLIVGKSDGTFSYYKNTGSASTPAFTLQTGAADPLNGQAASGYSAPSLGDVNGDGLVDLVVGQIDGTFSYYKNTGTRTIPVFNLQSGAANPLNGVNVGIYANPALKDLDADGHVDLIAGNLGGTFSYFRSQPQTAPVINPAIHPQINITEDINPASNTGLTLTSIINLFGVDGWYDNDANPLQGIAIVAANTSIGDWQYSNDNGSTWNSIGNPSSSSAFLLANSGSARLRFAPNPNVSGIFTDALTFAAWDQTTGSNLGTANASLRGGNTAFSAQSGTIKLNIDGANDAPLLNINGNPALPTLTEDPATNTGMLISALIANMTSTGGGITDPDGVGSLQGIAVTDADGSHGTWQYSVDNGSSWTSFPAVGSGSALLLASDANTRIRFAPAPDFSGNATINFRAWDQTTGFNGGTGNASINDGSSAFSSGGTESASITITGLQDAPILNAAGNPTLTPILPDTPDASNPGTLVSQIIANMTATGGGISDPDAGAVQGIAVSSVDNSHGTWQYSINAGTTWFDFGTPSASAARLLAANTVTKMRFKPAAGYTGSATFLFVAWDQTAGTNGSTASITSRGGTKPYSLATDTGNIVMNYAPEITNTGSPTLTSIPKNVADANNTGTTVTQILASMTSSGGSYTDANTGSLQGIAITIVDQAHGTWQFTTNNGTTWTDVGATTSAANARLLIATASTKLRFKPNTDYIGNATFVFVAWDVSVGINGGTASATARGGARPFSLVYDTATINVFVPNAAPVLNAAGNPTLTNITKDIPDASNTGTLVSQIIANLTASGGSITDTDPGAVQGIAVTSVDQAHGTWQYTIDGVNWLNFGTPAVATARLLASDSNTRIRFKPAAGYTGNATFLFVAWDQSSGVNGGTLSASKRGGLTPFSLNTDTASIKVNP